MKARDLSPREHWRRVRRRRRAGLSLHDAGISAKTRTRYYAGLRRILHIVQVVCSWESLDEQLADWVESQWREGESLGSVSDALCGLSFHLPLARTRIPEAWRLFRTWRRVEKPDRAPPLPSFILWGLVGFSIHRDWPRMAALLALGFHAMLRTGELLKVSPADILVQGQRGVLRLRDTKTASNYDEMVQLHDIRVLDILRTVLPMLPHKDHERPIWNRSDQSFRESLDWLFTHFNLENFRFRGYSIRRGGASFDFDTYHNMERTLLRGRWQSSRVARIYITDALARLTQMRLSPTQTSRLQRFAAMCGVHDP